MRIGLVLVGFAVFGGADQYVGSIPSLSWGASLSLLSAPWLLIAFVAGWTRRDPKTAMLFGLACTYAALIGYGLMTLSPIENAHLTVQSALGFCRSEAPVLAGGLLTGPLFGWFGFRWRAARAWGGALSVTLAFCFEPLAEHAVESRQLTTSDVTNLEIIAGIGMTIYVVISTYRYRSTEAQRPR